MGGRTCLEGPIALQSDARDGDERAGRSHGMMPPKRLRPFIGGGPCLRHVTLRAFTSRRPRSACREATHARRTRATRPANAPN